MGMQEKRGWDVYGKKEKRGCMGSEKRGGNAGEKGMGWEVR